MSLHCHTESSTAAAAGTKLTGGNDGRLPSSSSFPDGERTSWRIVNIWCFLFASFSPISSAVKVDLWWVQFSFTSASTRMLLSSSRHSRLSPISVAASVKLHRSLSRLKEMYCYHKIDPILLYHCSSYCMSQQSINSPATSSSCRRRRRRRW